jgi:transposase
MTRRVITDAIWQQLQTVMKTKGCHRWNNDREIMEAILWKLRTGAPWRDVPQEFCPWKTAYNRFNRWAAKGLWEDFFLSYEERLIKSGFSSTEVMSALTSMQVELGITK